MQRDLTQGNLLKNMLGFSVPYLISSFLQTFYGMADLFITGQFNGAGPVTAVSVGSQLMHMLTVIIVGLAMGGTVYISRAVGGKRMDQVSRYIGNSIDIFVCFAAVLTLVLLRCIDPIIGVLSTPAEAVVQTRQYIFICFLGIPFITAYNVVSSIYRGLGDTRSPMIFVGIAGLINIGFDWLLIGPFGMGAAGAAIATVGSQGFSVALAVLYFIRHNAGVRLTRGDLRPDRETVKELLGVGVPVSAQDGFIQVSFLVITAIANSRGVYVAAAVGIVEKIICFLFLVPSSMLSTVATVSAQNIGAGQPERSKRALYYGIGICVAFGAVIAIGCQFCAPELVGLFVTGEPEVMRLGGEYLRVYVIDVIVAGCHFCFSGYFSACGKSVYSFLHNIVSILFFRIPGAWLASVLFPATLYPLGVATLSGSTVSLLICLFLYRRLQIKAAAS